MANLIDLEYQRQWKKTKECCLVKNKILNTSSLLVNGRVQMNSTYVYRGLCDIRLWIRLNSKPNNVQFMIIKKLVFSIPEVVKT